MVTRIIKFVISMRSIHVDGSEIRVNGIIRTITVLKCGFLRLAKSEKVRTKK